MTFCVMIIGFSLRRTWEFFTIISVSVEALMFSYWVCVSISTFTTRPLSSPRKSMMTFLQWSTEILAKTSQLSSANVCFCWPVHPTTSVADRTVFYLGFNRSSGEATCEQLGGFLGAHPGLRLSRTLSLCVTGSPLGILKSSAVPFFARLPSSFNWIN